MVGFLKKILALFWEAFLCYFSISIYGDFRKSDGNIFKNEDFSVHLAKNAVYSLWRDLILFEAVESLLLKIFQLFSGTFARSFVSNCREAFGTVGDEPR